MVDLGPIRSAVRDDVTDFAAATRTPLFYITPDAANGSAEGASLSREGLLFKVRDRIREADEAVEQVMSLAFAFDGDAERASLVDLEVILKKLTKLAEGSEAETPTPKKPEAAHHPQAASPKSAASPVHVAESAPTPPAVHETPSTPDSSFASEAEKNAKIIELPVVKDALRIFDATISDIKHSK